MEEMNFEGVEVLLQKDEVLTFKLGTMINSPITEKKYLVKKVKYLGKGRWEVLGEKEELEKGNSKGVN